jgi:hypothetical protein
VREQTEAEYIEICETKSCPPLTISSTMESAKITPRKLKNMRAAVERRAKRFATEAKHVEEKVHAEIAEANAFSSIIDPVPSSQVKVDIEKDVVPEYVRKFCKIYVTIPMTRGCIKLPKPTVKLDKGLWVYINPKTSEQIQADCIADVDYLTRLLGKTYRSKVPPTALNEFCCKCTACIRSKPTWTNGTRSFYFAPPQANTVISTRTTVVKEKIVYCNDNDCSGNCGASHDYPYFEKAGDEAW